MIKHSGSLQRTMIVYFLMMAFASLLIGTELIVDFQSQDLRSELRQNLDQTANRQLQSDDAFQPIQKLRNKAILMVALLLTVVLILLTMFIKNITGPLQHMIEVSKAIAGGDLSQTVSIRTDNELAELGNTVNELTSNLQEMILLSNEVCTVADGFALEVSDLLNDRESDPARKETLQSRMRGLESQTRLLRDIISNCKFYKIGA
jgi:methyl-accepting chemotaxis protein